MKKAFFVLVMLAIMAVLIEVLSATGLYYFFQSSPWVFRPHGPAAGYAVEVAARAVGALQPMTTTSPSPFYEADPRLGYRARAGRYTFDIAFQDETYSFEATVLADGSRATAYTPVDAPHSLHMFGDSYGWGFGNNDEQTLAWRMQARHPEMQVINHAQNGYGMVQGLIGLRGLADLGPGDLVVFVYGAHLDLRTVAAPSWMKHFAYEPTVHGPDFAAKATHPYAKLEDGKVVLTYIPLFCERAGAWCEQSDPPAESVAEITAAVIAEARGAAEDRGAAFAVAYTRGPDGSPVLSALAEAGVTVIDVRPQPGRLESDSFRPFDPHPGPLSNYHFFRKLDAGLIESGLLPSPD